MHNWILLQRVQKQSSPSRERIFTAKARESWRTWSIWLFGGLFGFSWINCRILAIARSSSAMETLTGAPGITTASAVSTSSATFVWPTIAFRIPRVHQSTEALVEVSVSWQIYATARYIVFILTCMSSSSNYHSCDIWVIFGYHLCSDELTLIEANRQRSFLLPPDRMIRGKDSPYQGARNPSAIFSMLGTLSEELWNEC